jgi:hypothetical protein
MKYFILSILLVSTIVTANDSESAIIKNCKEIIKTEKSKTNKTIYENCENILKEKEKNQLKLGTKSLETQKKSLIIIKKKEEKENNSTNIKEKKKYNKIASMNLFMAAYPGLIVGAAPKIEFISGNFLVGIGVGYFGVAEPGGGHTPDFDPAIGVLFNLGFNYSWDYFRVAITGEFYLGIPTHLTASLALTAGVKLFKIIEISGKIGLFTAGVSAGIHF